ncbi:2TM domain-containing protein [Methanobacterium aggregans]|uniref:2TM domain-containing protein n=2 Tax=Methanobacterium aggregans TaxID=1615586 RepID=UPI001AEAA55E|nr:2TM domain-containing protein [Methanobacterium aggregans]MBP2047015.1 hypothetical protein [Methanobacterium aggregans]
MMDETERYERAKQRVGELRDFYNHLTAYIIVNTVLAIVNIVTTPGSWWFYWVSIFWGIGLLMHGVSVFVKRGILSEDWEERKIREMMEKDKKG